MSWAELASQRGFQTLGTGRRAVRIAFGRDSVQLRTGRSIIDGNADTAAALRWVLDHPTAEDACTGRPGMTVDAICEVLLSLHDKGIILATWGLAWERRCSTDERAVP